MSETAPRSRPWYTATLGGMASYLDGATIVTVGMTSVILQRQFALSTWSVGALNSVLMFMFATGAVVGGRLGDVLGRRTVYAVDLVVYAAGVVTVLCAPDQATLFVGVIVTGLAMGADVPTSLALMAEEAAEGRQSSTVAYAQTLWLAGVAVVQILGFFVADLGATGARIMFAHLLVVAVVVWFLRRGVAESADWQRSRASSVGRGDLREAFRKPYGVGLLATGLYFVISGIMPNTVGQFGAFLVVHLGGSTVQVFSLIGWGTMVVGLAVALLFQRLADSPVRRVLLVIGLVSLAAGPLVALLGGFSLASLVVLFAANTVAGTWAGEGLYKVWSQEIFPTRIRSTAQGLTFGAARYVMAVFGLFTPTLVQERPALFMGILIALGAVATVIGLLWLPRLPRHGLRGAHGDDAADAADAGPHHPDTPVTSGTA
ncbi:MFS transporter [Streptomyces sp. NPDC003247]|uniref:MFS transporter n=1 Tax=Streptomyces sp. NPDC003247 TaxID=3364677 RepID=UPI0036C5F6B0